MKRFLVPVLFLSALAGGMLGAFSLAPASAQLSSSVARRLPVGTADPSPCSDGQVFNRTDTNKLRLCNDAAWADVGTANPLTTKGDLIAAATGGTQTRLPVGTNGHVLTADSAETTGVKWAAASGGGSGETKLSTTTFDLNSSAWQDLYTVPSGDLVVTRVVLRSPTVNVSSGNISAISFRSSGAGTPAINFVSAPDILALTSSARYVVGHASHNLASPTIAAASKVQASVDVADGRAATCVVEVYGYTF